MISMNNEQIFAQLHILEGIFSQWLYIFITQNSIGFACAILIIRSTLMKAEHHSLLGAWSANFVGVFFHELAHAIVGAILGAKPAKFIIFPQVITLEDGRKSYILGQVQFANLRWYNALPSAMAPLLLLFVAFAVEKYYWSIVPYNSLAYLVLYIYLLVVLILNAIPSSVDFIQAFKNPFGIILWFFILLILIVLHNYCKI